MVPQMDLEVVSAKATPCMLRIVKTCSCQCLKLSPQKIVILEMFGKGFAIKTVERSEAAIIGIVFLVVATMTMLLTSVLAFAGVFSLAEVLKIISSVLIP